MRTKRTVHRTPLMVAMILGLLASLMMVPASAENDNGSLGTVTWETGQGIPGALNCEDYEPGQVHWVLTPGGATINEAELFVDGQSQDIATNGGALQWVTEHNAEDIDEAYAVILDGSGHPRFGFDNANLVISDYCPAQVGSIIIEKVTDPPGVGGDFDFTFNGTQFSLAHGESETFDNLQLGQYTVSETVPESWELQGIVCSVDGDGSYNVDGSSVTIDLEGHGVEVTCTFTNIPPSSILFEKTYDQTPLEGDAAEFQLIDEFVEGDDDVLGAEIPLSVVNGRNIYCLDMEPADLGEDFWVRETYTPVGFDTADDFVVTAEIGTCAERLAELPNLVEPTITNESGPVDVVVTKVKENLDGPTDLPLPGFEFTLYAGPDDSGDVVATETTGVDGEVLFSDLEVNQEYTICETATPHPGYWTDGGCETFTPTLADVEDGLEFTFSNAPKADVTVGFDDVTGYTSAKIICVDGDGNEVDSVELTQSGSLDLDALDLGDYTCDIEIRNGTVPANGNGNDND